jgi:aryl-alcohol dehydrogenase-like predicted oxidoreductase
VGSSNFAGWDIATAQQLAGQRHFMGLVSEQSLYNLTVRTVELEVIPALRHYGVGLICWSPLAWGLLGGAFTGASEGRRGLGWNQPYVEEHRPQFEAYEAFCDELDEQPADALRRLDEIWPGPGGEAPQAYAW